MITTAVLVFLAFFLVLLLVLLAVSTYSDLVHRRGEVDDAWVWIEVRLKHRHDLVAELVEVEGHGARDRQALEAVAAARSRAAGAQAPADRMAAEDLLSGALRSLFAATGPTRTSRRPDPRRAERSWPPPRTGSPAPGGTTTTPFSSTTTRSR
ncbi:LemA family protein [Streptosporangium lutulentum]